MENTNNLNELNNLLFKTLRGVSDGSIDDKKAQTVTNVANSIINNSKVQLQAYKLTKGNAYQEAFGKPPSKTLKSSDLYTQKTDFAIFKGYDNIPAAISAMGKNNFEQEFKNWINKK